jgi:hypothetical protein
VWHTYAPDGRSLMIRRIENAWVATCGPSRVEAPTAAEAIRGALGPAAGDESVEAWIAEHAAELDSISG